METVTRTLWTWRTGTSRGTRRIIKGALVLRGRFSEALNDNPFVLQIHVLPSKAARFADAHPGLREHDDQVAVSWHRIGQYLDLLQCWRHAFVFRR
jgi:hypothetical protein